MFFGLALSDASSRLGTCYTTLGRNITEVMMCSHFILLKWHMIHVCTITGGINFNHLSSCLLGLCTVKLLLISILWGGFEVMYHSSFIHYVFTLNLFTTFFIPVWTHGFLRYWIHYSLCFIFLLKLPPPLSSRSPDTVVSVSLSFFEHFFISGSTRGAGLTLHSPYLSTEVNRFSKGLWRRILRNQDLNARCAPCSRSATAPRPSQWTELGIYLFEYLSLSLSHLSIENHEFTPQSSTPAQHHYP